MKEYRIVCDRDTTLRNGKVETEKGVLCVGEDGHIDCSVFITPKNAEYWLTYAKKCYAKRNKWGLNKIRQYNFHIQRREVSPWEDVS